MESPSADRRLPSPGAMLQALGITPSKALGQHFLHDRAIVRRIVRESGVTSEDTVLEIGPGLGILTGELAARVSQVVAIERDTRLAAGLRDSGRDNVKIIEADALDVDIVDAVGRRRYHVVANLPYSAGSAILRHLQESAQPPQSLTVMLQREVAERIAAAPPDMNLLAVSVQVYGTPRILFRVGKGAFVPPPNVESAVIRIETHKEPLLAFEQRDSFFRIVRAGFSQPRKQLINNLSGGLGINRHVVTAVLNDAGIDPTARPERLVVQDWLEVSQRLVEKSRR